MSAQHYFRTRELERTPSFSVNRIGEETGIIFAGFHLDMNLLHLSWPYFK